MEPISESSILDGQFLLIHLVEDVPKCETVVTRAVLLEETLRMLAGASTWIPGLIVVRDKDNAILGAGAILGIDIRPFDTDFLLAVWANAASNNRHFLCVLQRTS